VSKLLALFQIMRPHNCFGAGLAVLLGVYLEGGRSLLFSQPALLAAAVVWLVVAGSNVVNDICDCQVDRLQKPRRVLPSGRLPVSTALLAACLLFTGGLVLAIWISLPAFLVALAAAALGIMYSLYLKSSILTGNVVVGLLSGLSVLYGGMSVSRVDLHVLLAAGIVFAFVFIREILKAIADIDGDAHAGLTTIATRLGPRRTLGLFSGLALLFVLLTALPWLVEYAPGRYLLAIFVGVDLPLILSLGLLWKRFSRANLHLALSLTKIGWFLGLFALSNLK
jgi:geranylgeranylglycerol-phosphate geranylgeranyltransferase